MKPFVLALGAAAFLGLATPALATMNVPMSHGRYCGIGNSQSGAKPIDSLDAACMAHDRCAGSDAIPRCGCHTSFNRTVRSITRNPNEPEVIRALGRNMIAALSRVPCTAANGKVIDPTEKTASTARSR